VTIGGGYAIVPVIGRSLEKRGWLDEERFQTAFAKAQAFPGPIALSTAIICSQIILREQRAATTISGAPDAPTRPAGSEAGTKAIATLAATAGIVLPPCAALVLVGSVLGRIGQLPGVQRFLHGAGATVPGLVAAMLLRTGKKRRWTAPRAIATAALAAALALFPTASLPILLGALVLFYGMEHLWT
jgi:chromate transporter